MNEGKIACYKNNITPNEKQKILLLLIYMTQELPIQSLRFFENTLSNSNLTYKLIPRLIKHGYLERVNIGFNTYGEKEILLKGKALYDTLTLTKLGTSYIVGTLGTLPRVKKMHDFYKKNCTNNEINMQERFKRSVMTDIMFNQKPFIKALLEYDFLTNNTRTQLQHQLEIQNQYYQNGQYYYRGIDCKRSNFDFSLLGTPDEILGTGNNLAGSKFFGLYVTTKDDYFCNVYPIYNGNYYNVAITETVEAQFKNKLWSETRCNINDCIYIYQDANKIKSLIEKDELQNWQANLSLYRSNLYDKIYAFEYRNNFEQHRAIFDIDETTLNKKKYLQENLKFKNRDKIFTYESLGTANRDNPIYDAILDDTNYYVGVEQELYSISSVYKDCEYNNYQNNLCIICLSSQIEFYKTIFSTMKDKNKLSFIEIETINTKGGMN